VGAVLDVEALYRKYGPMVLRRCRALLRDEERARDATQEVFVRVLRRKDSLTGDAPSSLLYCVATNVCLNAIRDERRLGQAAGVELDEIAGADAVEAAGEARGLLEGIFAREEASTRTMAVLHYVDGLTLEETAARVGLSVSGLRRRLEGLRRRTAAYVEGGRHG